MLTRFLTLSLLTIVAGYGLVEAGPILAGPSLTIASPANSSAFASGIVAISGSAARAVALTLNGAPVLPDQNGAFSTTLAFPKGDTILTFVAKDRFGRTTTDTRTISVP